MFLAEDDCKKPVWILAEDVKVVSGFIPPWWISTDESSNHGRIAIFIGYDKLVTDFDYRNRISEDRVCGSGDFRDEIAKVMEFENYERQK